MKRYTIGGEKDKSMAQEQKPVKVIPRENAVFRLNENGDWFSMDEKFTHQKIINYFHSAIKRDEDGYFLEQEHEHYVEKVYFPYEETALFVFRIIKGDEIILCLNTGKKITLEPKTLVIKNDNLYVRNGMDLIKFRQNALIALAAFIDDQDGQYAIAVKGKRHRISLMEENSEDD
jgi:hypothetical protein